MRNLPSLKKPTLAPFTLLKCHDHFCNNNGGTTSDEIDQAPLVVMSWEKDRILTILPALRASLVFTCDFSK